MTDNDLFGHLPELVRCCNSYLMNRRIYEVFHIFVGVKCVGGRGRDGRTERGREEAKEGGKAGRLGKKRLDGMVTWR